MAKPAPRPKPTSILFFTLLLLTTLPAWAQPSGRPQLPVNSCLALLDSMKAKNPYVWIDEVWKKEDALFVEMDRPNRFLNPKDFNFIQQAASPTPYLAASRLREILPEWKNDTLKGSVPVKLFAFDPPFNQFALVIAPDLQWSSQVFFFTGNQLVGVKEVFHKNGLEIAHFKTVRGQTVVRMNQCIESGTGIWQYNWLFFQYQSGQIVPLLNVLKESNRFLPGFGRSFAYKTKYVSDNPLTIAANYEILFSDSSGSDGTFEKKTETHAYVPIDQNPDGLSRNITLSTLSNAQITALHVYAREELFVHAFAGKLKSALLQGNARTKNLVVTYLTEFVYDRPNEFSALIKASKP